jgi:putative ABC transport system permease protein
MNLAIRDIRAHWGRFALTAVGIGMLLMIVMGMTGIYVGLIEDATLLVDSVDADLWVVQKGTHGPFAELSHVPANLEHRLRALNGVERTRAFVGHTIQREHRGRSIRLAVRGLSWPEDTGKWLPISSGRPIEQPHFEAVADVTLGLSLGEEIRLGKDAYRIVGLTTNMVGEGGDGLLFTTVRDALEIRDDTVGEAERLQRLERREALEKSDMGMSRPELPRAIEQPDGYVEVPGASPTVNAILVDIRPGANLDQLKAAIERRPDVSVYTSDEQRSLLLTGTVDKARRQIGLFRVLLVVISAIIMALIIYTLTLDKVRDIAMLKLMGARNRMVLGLIVQQALLLGVLGYVVAFLLGGPLFDKFPRRVIIHDGDLVRLAVVVVAISIASSLIGIWRAAKVTPNEVIS